MMAITEIRRDRNIAFVLEGVRILETEYKIMQSQTELSLLPCMRYLRNGKEALLFLTGGNRTFADYIGMASAEQLECASRNLIRSLAGLSETGFLTCRKADIDFEKIFVNDRTGQISLLYYPLDFCLFRDESEVRETLKRQFSRYMPEEGEGWPPSVSDYVKGTEETGIASGRTADGHAALVSLQKNVPLEFVIDDTEYIIGRSRDLSDGVLPADRRVGRTHCRIKQMNRKWMLDDLGSINGTYLNSVRLRPGKSYELRRGDRVRIADLEFGFFTDFPEKAGAEEKK